MKLIRLAISNLAGSSFRSWLVFFCSALMAGFVVSGTLVIRGADSSLRLALERLGADIIVVPKGNSQRLETALLMGIPAHMWMPDTVVDDIRAVSGVEAASPQIYLSTLRGAVCCSVPEMFLIAYDPDTDFTLKPWLEKNLEGGLALAEAVGGSLVFVPVQDGALLVYGTSLELKGTLEATGTGLDQSMFFTFDTAFKIAEESSDLAVKVLDIPPRTVSSVLVRVGMDQDPHQVALAIAEKLPNVTPMETSSLFQGQREQILSLLNSVVALLGITWLLGMGLTTVIFALAVNQRRRQIGVMRALGARRTVVLQSLLMEAGLLAIAGGIQGIAIAALAIYLFRPLIVRLMGVPFLFPGFLPLAGLGLGALALVLVGVLLAAAIPIVRVSLQDPAISMRE
ncbi:MAG: FtsX-like permease family protein [Anaerolineae bacterium]|nr:FtsX-like permease family protein [Anaerolineae bacterium]